jgi:hypothetical protein
MGSADRRPVWLSVVAAVAVIGGIALLRSLPAVAVVCFVVGVAALAARFVRAYRLGKRRRR